MDGMQPTAEGTMIANQYNVIQADCHTAFTNDFIYAADDYMILISLIFNSLPRGNIFFIQSMFAQINKCVHPVKSYSHLATIGCDG